MQKIPFVHIKDAIKEPAFAGQFSIRKLEDFLGGKEMVQELHRHNFFYLLVLDKGQGEHRIDFVSYAITDHCVFFMRPGQVHDLHLKADSSGYLIAFTEDFYTPLGQSANQVFRSASSKNFCPLLVDRFDNLLIILARMLGEYNAKEENYLDVIHSSLSIFFVELTRRCADVESATIGKNAYLHERLNEFQQLVSQHVAIHKQPAWYAKQMNLTSYQLNAVTKAVLAKTSSEVINDFIVLEAKRYLLATANQISQIAWHLGYEDVSYFIRFFGKRTGHSPEAFRSIFS